MLRHYFIGIVILIGAILANLLASKIQCKSWYDLLQGLYQNKSYWNQITFKDAFWLIFFYPLILGIIAYTGNYIYQKLF